MTSKHGKTLLKLGYLDVISSLSHFCHVEVTLMSLNCRAVVRLHCCHVTLLSCYVVVMLRWCHVTLVSYYVVGIIFQRKGSVRIRFKRREGLVRVRVSVVWQKSNSIRLLSYYAVIKRCCHKYAVVVLRSCCFIARLLLLIFLRFEFIFNHSRSLKSCTPTERLNENPENYSLWNRPTITILIDVATL